MDKDINVSPLLQPSLFLYEVERRGKSSGSRLALNRTNTQMDSVLNDTTSSNEHPKGTDKKQNINLGSGMHVQGLCLFTCLKNISKDHQLYAPHSGQKLVFIDDNSLMLQLAALSPPCWFTLPPSSTSHIALHLTHCSSLRWLVHGFVVPLICGDLACSPPTLKPFG